MRKIICFIFIIIPSLSLFAQQKEKSLESIAAPSMPSAFIIGSQATEINKIKSMKQIETAFLTNFLDSSQNIKVPNNFSIEFNPYLLSERKNFNYESYIENDFKKSLIRNLSLSLTTTSNYQINDTLTSNAIGFGVRTILFNGKINEFLKNKYIQSVNYNQTILDIDTKIRAIIDGYKSMNKDKTKNKSELIDFIVRELEKVTDLSKTLGIRKYELINRVKNILENVPAPNDPITITDEFTIQFKDDFSDKFKESERDRALSNLRKEIENVQHKRYGFRVVLNYAQAFSFPTNDFDNQISPRWGLWTNVSYKPNNKTKKQPSNFEFIALARVISNNDNFINKYQPIDTTFNSDLIFDFGLKGMYEYKKISAGLEYIFRRNTVEEVIIFDGREFKNSLNNDSYKFMFSLDYRFTDNIIVSYNLGKSFGQYSNDSGNLVTGLSVNVAIGDIKISDLTQ